MKRFFAFAVLLISFCALHAQTAPAPSNRGVYVELGGSSLIYSMNYDFKFNRSAIGGWGARVGFGVSAIEDFSFVSVPLMINYLLGKNESFFEISAGPVVTLGNSDILYVDPDATPVIGSIYFGYRYQPSDQGFLFRVGLPINFGINSYYDWYTDDEKNEFYCLPYFPGVSFGYAF